MADGQIFKLSQVGTGDKVKLCLGNGEATAVSGTVAEILSEPQGLRLNGLPTPFPTSDNSLNETAWRIVELEPAVQVPVEPGFYYSPSLIRVYILYPDGLWSLNGEMLNSANAVREGMPLERLEKMADTARRVLDDVLAAIELDGSEIETVKNVGLDYGITQTVERPVVQEEQPTAE